MDEKCSQDQEVDGCYHDVEGLSGFSEKLPGASFVMTAFAFLWRNQHFFFSPVSL